MTIREFREIALISESISQKTFDVYPAGERQGEAVFCLLYELKKGLKKGTLHPTKRMVVYYDSGTELHWETVSLLKDLAALGANVEVRAQ